MFKCLPFFTDVPILHLIASPFPSVWHNMGDDRRAVHMPTVRKLNRILRLFVAHYLELWEDNVVDEKGDQYSLNGNWVDGDREEL